MLKKGGTFLGRDILILSQTLDLNRINVDSRGQDSGFLLLIVLSISLKSIITCDATSDKLELNDRIAACTQLFADCWVVEHDIFPLSSLKFATINGSIIF